MSVQAVIGIVAILVTIFSGLFGIIGRLLSRGIDALKEEIKGLRQDLKDHATREALLEREQSAHVSACVERHKRLDYEIADMKSRLS